MEQQQSGYSQLLQLLIRLDELKECKEHDIIAHLGYSMSMIYLACTGR